MSGIRKQIGSTKALEMANEAGLNITLPTLLTWIKEHNLGHQPAGSGKWSIFLDKFEEFLNGKAEKEA